MFLRVKKLIAGLWPFIVIFFILCAGLTSCTQIEEIRAGITSRFSGEKELDSALAVAEEFFEAVMDEDYPAAYALISDADKKEGSYEDFEREFRDVTRIVSVKMNWVEVKNNIAVVSIDLVDRYDGTEKTYKDMEVSLVKEEDESWKINFWP
ncbi:MAG: hypothetical protein ACQEP5_06525 [Actinomycetota bacterium]